VDLGWKLAATIAGWAGLGVLDSYELGRRPLHRRVIDEAADQHGHRRPEPLSADIDHPDTAGQEARRRAAKRIVETKTAVYFSFDLVLGHRYEHSALLLRDANASECWQTRAAAGRRLPHDLDEQGVLSRVVRCVDRGERELDLPGAEIGDAGRAHAERWARCTETLIKVWAERPWVRRSGRAYLRGQRLERRDR
jgi:hypothetical protein